MKSLVYVPRTSTTKPHQQLKYDHNINHNNRWNQIYEFRSGIYVIGKIVKKDNHTHAAQKQIDNKFMCGKIADGSGRKKKKAFL